MRAVRVVTSAALCLAAGLLSGCQNGSASGPSADDITSGLDHLATVPHAFTDVRRVGGHTWTIDGVVADDYRYRAKVAVDGHAAYEEVDVDDARWVKVEDKDLALGSDLAARLNAGGPVATLLGGGWVTDPGGAPSDILNPDVEPVPLDPGLVLDAVHAADDVRSHLHGLREWNQDAIYYIPKDDKFPHHREDGTRFDLVPPKQYDLQHPPASLPEIERAFEYDSVWIGSRGITRVERLLALPGPQDANAAPVFREVKLAGSARLRRLLEAGAQWSETMTYAVTGDFTVTAPTGATTVSLAAALKAIRAAAGNADDPAPTYGPIA